PKTGQLGSTQSMLISAQHLTNVRLSFFFSSRRRHTRWPRDWSSDVCSSDLPLTPFRLQPDFSKKDILTAFPEISSLNEKLAKERSEERRVGKECRSRWWPDHQEKK